MCSNQQESALVGSSKSMDRIYLCLIPGREDSTVLSNLALEAARDLNMLPLKVPFFDQYLDAV